MHVEITVKQVTASLTIPHRPLWLRHEAKEHAPRMNDQQPTQGRQQPSKPKQTKRNKKAARSSCLQIKTFPAKPHKVCCLVIEIVIRMT